MCILFILRKLESVWNLFLQDPLDTREACRRPRGDITQYQIRFQTGSVVGTGNVNFADCTAGRCSYNFMPPSNPPLSYDNVSVAAENVIGVGAARTYTTQTILSSTPIVIPLSCKRAPKDRAPYKSVKEGVGALSNVSTFNHKRMPMSCLQRLKAINWTLQSQVLMVHNSLNGAMSQ